MPAEINFDSRIKAASIHFTISITIALFAAGVVFLLWYPWPYRIISGGQSLFLIVVSVDIAMGPLLTAVIFNPSKSRRSLTRDLFVIGILQIVALVYGLHTVFVARPIALVFELDRFRVIAANDVYIQELDNAAPTFKQLPVTGPWLLGTRKAEKGAESTDALFMGLQGFDVAQRPKFWVPYEESKNAALTKARPISLLLNHYPENRSTIHEKLKSLGVSESEARFLPLVARESWVIILDPQGKIVDFEALNGFF
jgi:hypothetical protein